MLGDILLPNVALEHSGSYFHSKLEWASEAMIANATYFGNAQWAQEYLDYCHRDSHFKSRWLAAGGDWTGKVVIVGVYRAARYGFHKTVNQQSWGPARRRRHQGILSVDAGAAGIRRWCLSAQPSNWRGGPVRRRGRREMEIPARQYVVGTPGIVAHQRAVVDVRGQAPWRSVSASA